MHLSSLMAEATGWTLRTKNGAFGGKHKKRPIRFLGHKRQVKLAIWRAARGTHGV